MEEGATPATSSAARHPLCTRDAQHQLRQTLSPSSATNEDAVCSSKSLSAIFLRIIADGGKSLTNRIQSVWWFYHTDPRTTTSTALSISGLVTIDPYDARKTARGRLEKERRQTSTHSTWYAQSFQTVASARLRTRRCILIAHKPPYTSRTISRAQGQWRH